MRLIAQCALVLLAFAANSVLNRAAVEDGAIDPLAFATLRVAAGAVTLTMLASWRGGTDWLSGMRPGGVASLGLYLVGFSLAYLGLDAGVGALVLFGGVQVTMFGGAIAAGEAIPLRRWIGAGLALAGLGWMLWPGDAAISALHGALMMAAAFGWGCYSLIGRTSTDPLGATAANFVGAVPLVLVAHLVVGGDLVGASAPGVLLALISGAVTSGLGYALWYAILPWIGATRASLAQLTVPVIAAAGGVVFLAEAVDARLVIAGLLVLGGVTIGILPGLTTSRR